MRIIDENAPIVEKYTIDDLMKYKDTNQKVIATVLRYHEDDGLILDLGNDLLAYMSPYNFEDNSEYSNSTIISFIGRNIMAYVDEVLQGKVYLNRARVQQEYKKSFLSNLEVGTIIDTEILSIASFGAFVDLGYGVLGLLPIGDISIARFSDIYEVFSKGDKVKVVYKGELSSGYVVSHKELLGTWEENLQDFKVGQFCQGIVRDLKPYGAFIEIAPNLTGLAELPKYPIDIGDTVCVQLKSMNSEKLKVKLTILSKSSSKYQVKYKYKILDGQIKSWVYTPSNSIKCIKTVF